MPCHHCFNEPIAIRCEYERRIREGEVSSTDILGQLMGLLQFERVIMEEHKNCCHADGPHINACREVIGHGILLLARWYMTLYLWSHEQSCAHIGRYAGILIDSFADTEITKFDTPFRARLNNKDVLCSLAGCL